jgi:hypothetical protein
MDFRFVDFRFGIRGLSFHLRVMWSFFPGEAPVPDAGISLDFLAMVLALQVCLHRSEGADLRGACTVSAFALRHV